MGKNWFRCRMSRFSYGDWLLACFTAGILCGTASALAFGGPTVQSCILGASSLSQGWDMSGFQRMGQREWEAFALVFRRRSLEVLVGWLVGLTVASRLFFGVLTFYGGVSLSVVLSVLTVRKGVMGIISFLAALFPQGIFYFLVWYVLSVWAGQERKRLHILSGALLIAITGAGAFCEVLLRHV